MFCKLLILLCRVFVEFLILLIILLCRFSAIHLILLQLLFFERNMHCLAYSMRSDTAAHGTMASYNTFWAQICVSSSHHFIGGRYAGDAFMLLIISMGVEPIFWMESSFFLEGNLDAPKEGTHHPWMRLAENMNDLASFVSLTRTHTVLSTSQRNHK